jgi:hypothetical protein
MPLESGFSASSPAKDMKVRTPAFASNADTDQRGLKMAGSYQYLKICISLNSNRNKPEDLNRDTRSRCLITSIHVDHAYT